MMKLLTLNTHSLVEKDYQKKVWDFTAEILKHPPDVMALQEVNQSKEKEIAELWELGTYTPCLEGAVIRKDNHGLRVARMLQNAGLRYHWTWLPMKTGYGKYDEGMAFFSREKIKGTKVLRLSDTDDYENWRRRLALGIQPASMENTWFYNVHMGWWNDGEESFAAQWGRLNKHMKENHLPGQQIWLMGDFNNGAHVRGEGYDMVRQAGWLDSYELAGKKDEGFTACGGIDGWSESSGQPMRIDMIWCKEPVEVESSQVVFDGKYQPVVSDHCGVVVTAKG